MGRGNDNDDNNDDDSQGSTNSTGVDDGNGTNLNGTVANGTWWSPAAGEKWQIVLQSALSDTSVDVPVYDIDLFDNNASVISTLQSMNRKVICYFSAGSYENFRPDSSEFLPSDYGNAMDGWPGEWWSNVTSPHLREIMVQRLNLAAEKGCDGVDPDNIDGYENDNGLGLTEDDAVDFVTFLADAAHSRNMSIGLKNGGAIVDRVINLMQWELNEQCIQYDECDTYRPFIDAGKPVFHIEYPNDAPKVTSSQQLSICNDSSADGFSTVIKKMILDDWVIEC